MKHITFLGIIASTISYPMIFITILHSQWFNIYDHALSDLGNSGLNPSISWLFNLTLILTGSLITFFGIGILKRKLSIKNNFWKILLIFSGIFLTLIGIFPEDTGRVHYIFSVSFFTVIIFTLFSQSLSSYFSKDNLQSLIVSILALLSTFIWLNNWPWKGVAIQETLSGIIASTWLIFMSFKKT